MPVKKAKTPLVKKKAASPTGGGRKKMNWVEVKQSDVAVGMRVKFSASASEIWVRDAPKGHPYAEEARRVGGFPVHQAGNPSVKSYVGNTARCWVDREELAEARSGSKGTGTRRAMTLEMTWEELEIVVASGAAPRILLFGPPGTGKSHIGSTLQKDKEKPVFTVTVTPEMSAAEIRGHFVPKGDSFQWIDGPGVAAWRQGGRLVLNEIDQASADVLTMLHVILDDPGFARLTLPNEQLEEVRPQAGFTVVATTNAENPAAVLPAALYDRFPVQVKVKDVNPKAIQALPKDLRVAAKELAAHTDPKRRIGLRAWQTFAELRKEVGEELAAKAVFQTRAMDVLNGIKIAAAR